jgi:peptide/nickel transport system substrate-binding protein
MKKKTWLIKIAAIALSVLLCISATSMIPPAATTEQTKLFGGTLRVGLFGDVTTFMLGSHTHAESHMVGTKILETLVTYDFDLSVKPLLAESWEMSPDGKTYTFHLVRNATWHDGVPFTSADVKYTAEEIHKKYKPGLKDILAKLIEVETPDNYTAVYKFTDPVPPFIYYCGDFYGTIFPKHLYEGTDPLNNPYNIAPVGTGPFIFVEWKRGEYIKLKRNPNYWKAPKPYIDEIIFKIIKDRSAMGMAFSRREIDVVHVGFNLPDIALLEGVPGVKVELTKGKEFLGRLVLMFLNHNNPYIKDINVRKALFLSLDREKICKIAYSGYGVPVYSFFTPDIAWCYNKDAEFKDLYPFNLTLANQILDEAGYMKGSDGIRFVLDGEVWPEYAEEVKAYEVWREDLLKIGIDFKYKLVERTVGVVHLKDLTYGAIGVSGIWHGPVPQISMGRWLLSVNVGKPYVGNHNNYTNPRIDELLNIAMTNPNVTIQKNALYEIQEILTRDIPYIPLVLFIPPTIYWEDEWGGIPEGPCEWAGQTWSTYWWKKGVELSPESILKLIEDTEAELQALASWFYDITEAQKKLTEARDKYQAGDYRSALTLTTEAKGLAVPPYWLYATIAVIIIVAIVGTWLYIRRKRIRRKGKST